MRRRWLDPEPRTQQERSLQAAHPRAWSRGVQLANAVLDRAGRDGLFKDVDLLDKQQTKRWGHEASQFVEVMVQACVERARYDQPSLLGDYPSATGDGDDLVDDDVVATVAVAARRTLNAGLFELAARSPALGSGSALIGIRRDELRRAFGRHLVALVLGSLTFLVLFGILYIPFGSHGLVLLVAAAAGLGVFSWGSVQKSV